MNNFQAVSLYMPRKERMKVYTSWVENGWWTLDEAICVFLKYKPETAYDRDLFYKITSTSLGEYIQRIAERAVSERSINIIIDEGPRRALCKDWVEWAKQYPLIQLDPNLIKVLEVIEKQRSNESYRPKEENDTKVKFLTATKIILHICFNARLSDIIEIIVKSAAIEELPSDRTLREWIRSENIKLRETRPSDKEIIQITQKLSSLLQPSPTSK